MHFSERFYHLNLEVYEQTLSLLVLVICSALPRLILIKYVVTNALGKITSTITMLSEAGECSFLWLSLCLECGWPRLLQPPKKSCALNAEWERAVRVVSKLNKYLTQMTKCGPIYFQTLLFKSNKSRMEGCELQHNVGTFKLCKFVSIFMNIECHAQLNDTFCEFSNLL